MKIKITQETFVFMFEFEKVPDDYVDMNEYIVEIPDEKAKEWTQALTDFEKMQFELMAERDKYINAQLEEKKEKERGPLYKKLFGIEK